MKDVAIALLVVLVVIALFCVGLPVLFVAGVRWAFSLFPQGDGIAATISLNWPETVFLIALAVLLLWPSSRR